jgi:hypothetical protein
LWMIMCFMSIFFLFLWKETQIYDSSNLVRHVQTCKHDPHPRPLS